MLLFCEFWLIRFAAYLDDDQERRLAPDPQVEGRLLPAFGRLRRVPCSEAEEVELAAGGGSAEAVQHRVPRLHCGGDVCDARVARHLQGRAIQC